MAQEIGRFKSEEARAEFYRLYDEVRGRWPVPSTELDVDTRFGSTHVRRSGDPNGSPVVLIHPHTGTSLAWWRVVEPFAAGQEVFALDTIGAMGKSVQTKPIEGAADYSTWLGDVIAALELDSPHLVGYSEGGFVAMCAAMDSASIGSLTAIEPGGIARISTGFLGSMLFAGIKAQFSDRALQDFAERISPGVTFAPGEMEMVLFGGKNFRQALPFPKRFEDEDLRRITVPTLLYMAANTELYDPDRAAERAGRLISDVEIVIVPEAQHGLPFQYPELTTKTILEFIAGVEAR
jgi:pimeloyl-ACP methyl ester carboxylesterase